VSGEFRGGKAGPDEESTWTDILRKLVGGGDGGDGGGRAARQVQQLIEIALRKGRPGADLREEAYAIGTEPVVRLWLDQSEHRLEHLPGAPRLRKLRIRGVLRFLYGTWEGMEIARPRLPEPTRERETKLFARRDELLWLPVEGIWLPRGWRPVEDRLQSETVRAILFMRARAFESRVSSEKSIPGKLPKRRGERLLFDTEAFIFDAWTRRRFREFR
jgi:hypothetical protein